MQLKTLIAAIIAGLLVVFTMAFNRAANHLVLVSEDMATVEYAEGSALNGSAFVQLQTDWKPVWLSIHWQWCPSVNPLRWCITFDGDTAEGEAMVATNGSSLFISDALFTTVPIDMVFAGFVTANAVVEGNIKQAQLKPSNNLGAVAELDANIMFSDVDAMGFGFANHRIKAMRNTGEDFIIEIIGDEANGMAKASENGRYSATLSLSPPDSVSHMIKLPKNPDGSFRYEVSGTLPVVQ